MQPEKSFLYILILFHHTARYKGLLMPLFCEHWQNIQQCQFNNTGGNGTVNDNTFYMSIIISDISSIKETK